MKPTRRWWSVCETQREHLRRVVAVVAAVVVVASIDEGFAQCAQRTRDGQMFAPPNTLPALPRRAGCWVKGAVPGGLRRGGVW